MIENDTEETRGPGGRTERVQAEHAEKTFGNSKSVAETCGTRTKSLCHQRPRGRRNREGLKLFKDIMAENFTNLAKDINLQIQEAEQTPNRINPKKSGPSHITNKCLKTQDNEKVLK